MCNEENYNKDCCNPNVDDVTADCRADNETRDDIPSAYELMDKLAATEKAFDAVQKERDDYLALAQRVQADFDNFRKRNKSAIAESYESAVGDTVLKILPVLDNLERALQSMEEGECPEAFVQGIDMVVKQFKDVLSKMEVEEIEAMGQPFDPNFHNAVMQGEPDEGQHSNIVLEVFQKGYKYKDNVIRYSMVKVAK